MEVHKPFVKNFVFTLSRWLGTTPCNQQGTFSRTQFAYAVIVTVLVNVCYVFYRVQEFRERWKIQDPNIITKNLVAQLLHLMFVLSSVTWTCQCWIRKKVLESVLHKLNTTSKYPDQAIVLCGVLIQLLTSLVRNIIYGSFFMAHISMLLQLMDFTIVSQFSSILGSLNDDVLSLTNRVRQNQPFSTRMHFESIEMAKLVNKVYEWQILLALGQILLVGTSFTYYSLTPYQLDPVNRVGQLLYSMGNVIAKLITLHMITARCHSFTGRAEAFNNELFKLMRSNKELCRDNKLFLYVTMRQTVKFTACGFFNLGYPLVTSIIAAATTYLVILLQFSMPQNKQ